MSQGQRVLFSKVMYFNCYDVNHIEGYVPNYRLLFDQQMKIVRTENFQLQEYVRQTSTRNLYCEGQDYHVVLLGQKRFICFNSAIFQIGNNFHKVIDIPNLLPNDCLQNFGLCGKNLIISNQKGAIYSVEFVEKKPLLRELNFNKTFVEVLSFANKAFLVSDDSKLYQLNSDNLENPTFVCDFQRTSIVDVGGLLVFNNIETSTKIVNTCDLTVASSEVEVQEFRFNVFDENAELSFLGMSYKSSLVLEKFPEFSQLFYQRAKVWFDYVFREGSPEMWRNLCNYASFDQEESRALAEVRQKAGF